MRRTNLFPCPLFTGEHGKAANSGDCKLTYKGGGQLVMSPLSGATIGGWCDFVVPVSPGAYVVSVNFDFPTGTNDFRGNLLSVNVTDKANGLEGDVLAELSAYGSGNGRRDLRFTVPSGVSYVRLRFRGSQTVNVSYLNPQVELASTYDAAVSGGGTPATFNGDTMPKVG